MVNLIHSMHFLCHKIKLKIIIIGGAIACLMETCISHSRCLNGEKIPTTIDILKGKKLLPLGQIQISLLTPCKGQLEIHVVDHTLGLLEKENSKMPSSKCITAQFFSSRDKQKSKFLVEANTSYAEASK